MSSIDSVQRDRGRHPVDALAGDLAIEDVRQLRRCGISPLQRIRATDCPTVPNPSSATRASLLCVTMSVIRSHAAILTRAVSHLQSVNLHASRGLVSDAVAVTGLVTTCRSGRPCSASAAVSASSTARASAGRRPADRSATSGAVCTVGSVSTGSPADGRRAGRSPVVWCCVHGRALPEKKRAITRSWVMALVDRSLLCRRLHHPIERLVGSAAGRCRQQEQGDDGRQRRERVRRHRVRPHAAGSNAQCDRHAHHRALRTSQAAGRSQPCTWTAIGRATPGPQPVAPRIVPCPASS